MFVFIGSCVIIILALVVLWMFLNIRKKTEDDKRAPSLILPTAGLIVGIVLLLSQCIYTQDIGEAVVLRNFGGSLAGYTTEAGIHFKAPWQDALDWDIRNRLINFYRDAEYTYDNGSYNGAMVTINDFSGTKAECDVQVIYSINPDMVEQLYADYGTQEAYVSSYVSNDVRQTTRDCAGQFSTIQLLTDKETFAKSIQDTLSERWAESGVVVESVSVQDIRYADSITDAYANAQSAQVEQQRAQNEQDTARIEAETRIIESEGVAESNRILAESLTDEVLTQNYIDAINNSNTIYVVPEGSAPMIGVTGNNAS